MMQTLVDATEPSQTAATETVYLVEDDLDAREALAELLSPSGLRVRAFGTAEEFLSGFSGNGPSCLLLDERLPGMSGSELLRRINSNGVTVPAVVVTAYATTSNTVAAMRSGATAVLDKPCSDSTLRAAVRDALDHDHLRRRRDAARDAARRRFDTLSDGERQVLHLVLQGTPNKQIARRLNVCVRTVEARRSRIYQQAGVRSVAELVRLCVAAGMIDS